MYEGALPWLPAKTSCRQWLYPSSCLTLPVAMRSGACCPTPCAPPYKP